ncbi:unnamed protein product [Heterobilharzia americana]|nr:unnamed protein product [Heterobilharzia americana]
MSGSRRGLVAPQNTFLDKIIRRCNGQFYSFVLANARIVDYPIVYCNEGFSRLTGYSRVDIMQKSGSCAFFYGDQTTKEMRERLLKALDTQTPDQIEMLFYKKNRLPFWLLVCVAPVRNECEEVVLFLLAFRDITALKTPFEDEDTVKGLSKFARLARSVTRNRSVLQQLSASQTSSQSTGLSLYRSNRLTTCSGGGGGGDNDGGQMEQYSSPALSNYQNLSTTGSSRFHDSSKSDPEKAAMSTSSWLDLVPPYKQEAPKTPPHIILHYVAFKNYLGLADLIFNRKTMDDVSFLVVDSIVDVIFFIDIVLNFHTTFVGPNGEVISDATIIRINYLKGWFIVDVLSCLPYDVFNAFQPEATQSTISSLFGALKVVRLLRIGRVTRKLDQYLEYMAASLLLMISGFVLLAHWLACVWYSVGQTDLKNGIYYGWIPRLLNDIDQGKTIPANWTSGNPPLPRTMTYVTSLYFTLSLITSIGFGNVSATTFGEKLVAAVFMLIGAFGYATIFGNVTTIFQGMYATRSRYHDMMASVKDFIKTHSVPKDLAERVIDYVTSTWAITKGIDTAKVLNYCPKDMKADLCIHLNRMVFNEHPAFRLASDGCLRALAVNFNTIHTAPGDLIFHQGESIDQLCFVVSGSLEVIQDDEIVAFLGRGDVFGEPFWKDPNSMSHSAATVRALTYCDLHCIKKDCLLQVLKFYSAFANSFARNLVLTYDLKHDKLNKYSNIFFLFQLIFRKLADVRREYELAEHRKADNALSSLRADHPVRRMIHKFRRIGAHNQSTNDSPVGSVGAGGIGSISDAEVMRLSRKSMTLADYDDLGKDLEFNIKSEDKQKYQSKLESPSTSTVTNNNNNSNPVSALDEIASRWGKRMEMKGNKVIVSESVQQSNRLSNDITTNSNENTNTSNSITTNTKPLLQSKWGSLMKSSTIHEEHDTYQNKSKNLSTSVEDNSNLKENKKKLELSNEAILESLMRMQNELKSELGNLMDRMNSIDDKVAQLVSTIEIKSTTDENNHHETTHHQKQTQNQKNNYSPKILKSIFIPPLSSTESSTSLKSRRTSSLAMSNKVHPWNKKLKTTVSQESYSQNKTQKYLTNPSKVDVYSLQSRRSPPRQRISQFYKQYSGETDSQLEPMSTESESSLQSNEQINMHTLSSQIIFPKFKQSSQVHPPTQTTHFCSVSLPTSVYGMKSVRSHLPSDYRLSLPLTEREDFPFEAVHSQHISVTDGMQSHLNPFISSTSISAENVSQTVTHTVITSLPTLKLPPLVVPENLSRLVGSESLLQQSPSSVLVTTTGRTVLIPGANLLQTVTSVPNPCNIVPTTSNDRMFVNLWNPSEVLPSDPLNTQQRGLPIYDHSVITTITTTAETFIPSQTLEVHNTYILHLLNDLTITIVMVNSMKLGISL